MDNIFYDIEMTQIDGTGLLEKIKYIKQPFESVEFYIKQGLNVVVSRHVPKEKKKLWFNVYKGKINEEFAIGNAMLFESEENAKRNKIEFQNHVCIGSYFVEVEV